MLLFNNLSFKNQFYLAFASLISIVIFSAFSYNIVASYNSKVDSFIQESELQASLIADSSVAPLMFMDRDGLEAILSKLDRYESILQVKIFELDGSFFGEYNKNIKIQKVDIKNQNDQYFLDGTNKSSAFDSTSFIIKQKIMLNDEEHGLMYMQKSTISLNSFIMNSIINTMIFSFFLFLLMLLFIYAISKKLITPLVTLSERLGEVSLSQDYSQRLKYDSKNEIGKLYDAFNNLFHSIEIHQDSRNEALAQAKNYQEHLESLTAQLEHRVQDRTQELQDSLDTLKKAQWQLVESEKMAALGSLVSGVAHEVNTPLGNAVIGSTIIKRESEKLLKSMKDETLKKSQFEESLEFIDETSRLLYKSINTAANLIKSFKRISVDQSIEIKREFDLVEYIDEIFKTFHNKLKHIPIHIEVIAPKELYINSYPGDFAQLLNNFIQNSIFHAFDSKENDAKITIEISLEKNNSLLFIYRDNGAGMSEEIRVKAFEPFVTTKRNSGGTGLGLNIAYNIVTQKLYGIIKLESKKNEGTSFKMSIPLDEKASK
ncbi:ATP-binding protein [Sulfurimonas sp.]|uniref:ATP-binding protein n=1 Tax=Sulfurimonas sp. TaxID=2022749 RepID=UPI002AAFBBF2|nr:ATP-binding protein [Sulfurimonas sp.]